MLFPAAALADQADRLARRDLQLHPIEHLLSRAGVRVGHPHEPDRRLGRAERLRPPPRGVSGAPRAARASDRRPPRRPHWRGTGSTRRSGRYSSGANTSTVIAAWSPIRRPPSRTPMVTATRPTPRVAASSRTEPDRSSAAAFASWPGADSLADLPELLDLDPPPVERTQGRQPRTTSRKWVESRRSARQLWRVRCSRRPADQPHEDRDERQRQQHDQGRGEIDRRNPGEDRDRDEQPSTTCGRYRPK